MAIRLLVDEFTIESHCENCKHWSEVDWKCFQPKACGEIRAQGVLVATKAGEIAELRTGPKFYCINWEDTRS